MHRKLDPLAGHGMQDAEVPATTVIDLDLSVEGVPFVEALTVL
jgi:hypothetical protein